jgi:hypothetical protein
MISMEKFGIMEKHSGRVAEVIEGPLLRLADSQ